MKIDKKHLITYIILTILALTSGILYLTIGEKIMPNYREGALLFMILGIVCIFVPILAELLLKIKLSFTNFLIYEGFIMYTVFFCSIWNFYDIWSGCDIIAHTLSGVIFAVIFYDAFTQSSKNKVSLIWLFVVCLAFACMGGVLWEIFEFTTDAIRNQNMQKYLSPLGEAFVGRSALIDTMLDAICNLVGAVIGSIVAVFLQKDKQKKICNNENVIE